MTVASPEMRLDRVFDLEPEAVEKSSYHLAIFCSSSESRAAHVARMHEGLRAAREVAFSYESDRSDPIRRENDDYFSSRGVTESILADSDDGPVYTTLNDLRPSVKPGDDTLRILVDYSSMSRVWYAGILTWARYAAPAARVSIDFLYAVGDHQSGTEPVVIDSISSLPGFEGEPAPLSRAIAVFGLGFDGLAALCVLDRLEPHLIYSYLASPAAFEEYPERARNANAELIGQHAKHALELPLQSVEQTYRYLAEVLRPHLAADEITLIPTGPKPHVLAAILLALRFRKIGCLHVAGKRRRRADVGTSGDVVHTRVELCQSLTSAPERKVRAARS